MKIDASTTRVLKNFSSINTAMMVREGNVIRTISPSKTIMAKATLTQNFPRSFAIHDLSRFLGTISLFEDGDVEFGDRSLTIKQGNDECSIGYTDPSLIVVAPEKDIDLKDADVSFSLTEETLNKVNRALGVVSLPEIAVTGVDGKLYVQAVDTKGTTSDVFSVEVGKTEANFRAVFRSDNIKLMGGNYEVKISAKGLAHFKGDNIEYWIAVEANSTYDK
jgi:hypothetical protein